MEPFWWVSRHDDGIILTASEQFKLHKHHVPSSGVCKQKKSSKLMFVEMHSQQRAGSVGTGPARHRRADGVTAPPVERPTLRTGAADCLNTQAECSVRSDDGDIDSGFLCRSSG